ncbi:MAG: Uncharacterised protein [Flavobacteriia bacterium]|nr:MAG: Uncharacterised protein [Flavobacteriia bacterium]
MMRRMMLMAASWPSNNDAAVTMRTLFLGVYIGGFCMGVQIWQRVLKNTAAQLFSSKNGQVAAVGDGRAA